MRQRNRLPATLPPSVPPTDNPPAAPPANGLALRPQILTPKLAGAVVRYDERGMPIVAAPPKLLWCVPHQTKFNPKDYGPKTKPNPHIRCCPIQTYVPKFTSDALVSSIDAANMAKSLRHYSTGDAGADRCLGGGLVRGSTILVGGRRGVGKSTLLGQLSHYFSSHHRMHGLYGVPEERTEIVGARLQKQGFSHPLIKIAHTRSLERLEEHISVWSPHYIIVDSGSRLSTLRAPGQRPGSVLAMNAVIERLMEIAHHYRTHPAIFIVAHENKDGEIAGSTEDQHDVDVIWHFRMVNEARVLVCEKDRFANAPLPIRVTYGFVDGRLVEVKGGVAVQTTVAASPGGVGSLLFPCEAGSKSVTYPVDVYADDPHGPDDPSPQPPRAAGIEDVRFRDVLAALALHTTCATRTRTVTAAVRTPEGANVTDRAVDAALALAVISCVEKRILPPAFACFGEISPAGKLYPDAHMESRASTAKSAAVTTLLGPVVPAATVDALAKKGVTYYGVADLRGLVQWVLARCERSAPDNDP